MRHTAASPAYWDGATGNLVKRRTTGRFSWMLTMAPELGEETDLYTESAVVFYNRNFNIDAEEFAFDVAINSIGAGGGEITLRTRGHAREKLEIRPGCWLMLAAALQVRPPYAQGTPQPITHSYFRWYRVVNTAGDILEPGGGVFAREFTIVGPDWNVNALNQPQVAIVCPSAVAVFEKTTRLQTSSVWLPQ